LGARACTIELHELLHMHIKTCSRYSQPAQGPMDVESRNCASDIHSTMDSHGLQLSLCCIVPAGSPHKARTSRRGECRGLKSPCKPDTGHQLHAKSSSKHRTPVRLLARPCSGGAAGSTTCGGRPRRPCDRLACSPGPVRAKLLGRQLVVGALDVLNAALVAVQSEQPVVLGAVKSVPLLLGLLSSSAWQRHLQAQQRFHVTMELELDRAPLEPPVLAVRALHDDGLVGSSMRHLTSSRACTCSLSKCCLNSRMVTEPCLPLAQCASQWPEARNRR